MSGPRGLDRRSLLLRTGQVTVATGLISSVQAPAWAASPVPTLDDRPPPSATLSGPIAAFANETVTYTAAIASATPGGPTPTGTVSLVRRAPSGDTPVAGAQDRPLDAGSARLVTTAPASGQTVLVAIYSGDADHAPAETNPLTLVVTPADGPKPEPTMTVTDSGNHTQGGQNLVTVRVDGPYGPGTGAVALFFDEGSNATTRDNSGLQLVDGEATFLVYNGYARLGAPPLVNLHIHHVEDEHYTFSDSPQFAYVLTP